MANNYANEELKLIKELYDSGLGSPSIAKKLNNKYTVSAIASLIKRKWGLRSSSQAAKKYTVNSDFFKKIDTEEKAYWLGFLIADGYITSRDNKIGLSLCIDDIEHLEKFKKDINATYPIKIYNPSKTGYSKKQYCRIIISDLMMYLSVQDYGLVEHKSNVLQPPNKKDIKGYEKDFIRGFFDGNGSITFTNTALHKNEYQFKVISTDAFLDFIKEWIELNTSIKIKRYYKRKDEQIVSSIEVAGNYQVKEILDLLYKDSTVYLERKYNRYINLCNLLNSRSLQKCKD